MYFHLWVLGNNSSSAHLCNYMQWEKCFGWLSLLLLTATKTNVIMLLFSYSGYAFCLQLLFIFKILHTTYCTYLYLNFSTITLTLCKLSYSIIRGHGVLYTCTYKIYCAWMFKHTHIFNSSCSYKNVLITYPFEVHTGFKAFYWVISVEHFKRHLIHFH